MSAEVVFGIYCSRAIVLPPVYIGFIIVRGGTTGVVVVVEQGNDF